MKDIAIERTAPTGLADAVRCKVIDFGLAACCGSAAVSDLLKYEFGEDYADQQVNLMSPKAGTLIPDPE